MVDRRYGQPVISGDGRFVAFDTDTEYRLGYAVPSSPTEQPHLPDRQQQPLRRVRPRVGPGRRPVAAIAFPETQVGTTSAPQTATLSTQNFGPAPILAVEVLGANAWGLRSWPSALNCLPPLPGAPPPVAPRCRRYRCTGGSTSPTRARSGSPSVPLPSASATPPCGSRRAIRSPRPVRPRHSGAAAAVARRGHRHPADRRWGRLGRVQLAADGRPRVPDRDDDEPGGDGHRHEHRQFAVPDPESPSVVPIPATSDRRADRLHRLPCAWCLVHRAGHVHADGTGRAVGHAGLHRHRRRWSASRRAHRRAPVPTLIVNPGVVVPGRTVQVVGLNWAPNQVVTIGPPMPTTRRRCSWARPRSPPIDFGGIDGTVVVLPTVQDGTTNRHRHRYPEHLDGLPAAAGVSSRRSTASTSSVAADEGSSASRRDDTRHRRSVAFSPPPGTTLCTAGKRLAAASGLRKGGLWRTGT